MEDLIAPHPGISGLQQVPAQGVIVAGMIYSVTVQGGRGRSLWPHAHVRGGI